jgi:hypothetical protein
MANEQPEVDRLQFCERQLSDVTTQYAALVAAVQPLVSKLAIMHRKYRRAATGEALPDSALVPETWWLTMGMLRRIAECAQGEEK